MSRLRPQIRGALDQVPPDAILHLVSAIWFKAQWRDKFDAKRTVREAVFHLADGGERRVPMMMRRESSPCSRTRPCRR
jgi:serpin B